MSMTPMEGIAPLWDKMPLLGDRQESAKTEGVPLFGDIFRSAVDNVRQTDAEKTALQYQLAIGELDNPAELSIANTKAQYSVDLLLQLRNKALDAYSELMRISL